jgi:hypothetical protein
VRAAQKINKSTRLNIQIKVNANNVHKNSGAPKTKASATPANISKNKKTMAKTTTVTVRKTAAGITQGFPVQTTTP